MLRAIPFLLTPTARLDAQVERVWARGESTFMSRPLRRLRDALNEDAPRQTETVDSD